MARRKKSRVLLSILLLIMVGAVVAVFFTQRRLVGAVPESAPLLSLAVGKPGYFVATERGAFTSKDGANWTRVGRFGQKRVLAATGPQGVLVLSDKTVLVTEDMKEFTAAHGALQRGVAMTVDYEGNIYIAEDRRHLALIRPDGSFQRVTAATPPRDIVTLGAVPGTPVTLFSGGISSGLWRSNDGGVRWRAVLKTPTRAVLVDPTTSRKVYVGTAGGVFSSTDGGVKWRYTEFREPVEALAYYDGRVYALTEDRVIFASKDGVTDWTSISQKKS